MIVGHRTPLDGAVESGSVLVLAKAQERTTGVTDGGSQGCRWRGRASITSLRMF